MEDFKTEADFYQNAHNQHNHKYLAHNVRPEYLSENVLATGYDSIFVWSEETWQKYDSDLLVESRLQDEAEMVRNILTIDKGLLNSEKARKKHESRMLDFGSVLGIYPSSGKSIIKMP